MENCDLLELIGSLGRLTDECIERFGVRGYIENDDKLINQKSF